VKKKKPKKWGKPKEGQRRITGEFIFCSNVFFRIRIRQLGPDPFSDPDPYSDPDSDPFYRVR